MFCQQVLVEDLGPDVPVRFLRAVFRTGALNKFDFGTYTCYAADADSSATASVDLAETSKCFACSSRNLTACVLDPLDMFVCNVIVSQNGDKDMANTRPDWNGQADKFDYNMHLFAECF